MDIRGDILVMVLANALEMETALAFPAAVLVLAFLL